MGSTSTVLPQTSYSVWILPGLPAWTVQQKDKARRWRGRHRWCPQEAETPTAQILEAKAPTRQFAPGALPAAKHKHMSSSPKVRSNDQRQRRGRLVDDRTMIFTDLKAMRISDRNRTSTALAEGESIVSDKLCSKVFASMRLTKGERCLGRGELIGEGRCS